MQRMVTRVKQNPDRQFFDRSYFHKAWIATYPSSTNPISLQWIYTHDDCYRDSPVAPCLGLPVEGFCGYSMRNGLDIIRNLNSKGTESQQQT